MAESGPGIHKILNSSQHRTYEGKKGGREGETEEGGMEREGANEKSNQEIYLEKRSRREEADRETAG